jgi:hypothetical protein
MKVDRDICEVCQYTRCRCQLHGFVVVRAEPLLEFLQVAVLAVSIANVLSSKHSTGTAKQKQGQK